MCGVESEVIGKSALYTSKRRADCERRGEKKKKKKKATNCESVADGTSDPWVTLDVVMTLSQSYRKSGMLLVMSG